MAYTIYRNAKVIQVKSETVTPLRRPQDIVEPARKRSSYTVTVAVIDGLPSTVGIGDFKKLITPGAYVSVAVNDKASIIAVVNHSTGQYGCSQYKSTSFSEYLGILFFISIPAVLCYFIAQKAFATVKYHDTGWYILGFGALIVLLILRGVNKQYTDSKAALRELQN